MEKTQEYMIDPKKAGFLQIHGLPYVYINKGSGREGPSAKFLTDTVAKQLLKDRPDLVEVIVKNPDYEAPAPKPAKPANATGGKGKATAKASKETGTPASDQKDSGETGAPTEGATDSPPEDPAEPTGEETGQGEVGDDSTETQSSDDSDTGDPSEGADEQKSEDTQNQGTDPNA
ncbi:hypothetical protein WBJ53_15010 [Spirosoma sp. SC4-14]|uniref:hypothetical protein n=1 Tax=Spirosoma sp. SC4-14 TaxID=3128900 RepID=UPI0030D45202